MVNDYENIWIVEEIFLRHRGHNSVGCSSKQGLHNAR